MRIYFKYIQVLFRSEMVYKKSFILLCIGQFFVPFSVFFAMILLFDQFGNLEGWDFYEVALLFGVVHLSFALSEMFVRGFDGFSSLIINGEFDRILVRPRSTVVQVLGSKMDFTKIARILQGGFVLSLALARIEIQWTFLKGMTVFFMIIGGTCIMSGLFIIFASMCFWTVQGLEIANIFTDGGREMTQYPLTIYAKWLRTFFTFIIPFGMVNYVPMQFLMDRTHQVSIIYAFAPLYGLLFLIPSLMVWKFGVLRYKSTGS